MLNKVIHYLAIPVLVILLVADIYAGGGKRNGTAGAQELLIPVSARGLALSGAYLAGFEGLDAMFYNPAGVGVTENSADAMFSYMSYIADIGYSFAAVAVNFEGFGTLGLSLRTFDFGEIPVTNEANPYGTGATFSPTYVTVGITYSNALTDRIRVGVNVNMITEKIMNTSANGIAFDAGVQYNGVAGVEGLKFGVVLRNLGPKMSFDGPDLLREAFEGDDVNSRGSQFYKIDAAGFELPSQVEIGLAYERRFSDSYKGLIATSFQNNNFAHDEYRVGGEFSFNDLVFLRGGYAYVSEAVDDDDQAIFGPTFGAGLLLEGGIDIGVDYAYRSATYFDANHMITVKLGF